MKILETEDIKYKLISTIGNGATCTVYKGYPMEDSSKIFAIKIFSENSKKYFDKEISIHEILRPFKYFLSLKKSGSGYLRHQQEQPSLFNDDTSDKVEKVYYKIEEIAENGELFNYVYQIKKGFSESVSSKIFFNIVKSVKILHEVNIIHGDIKPENVLIGNDFKIKLIDFGFSQKIMKNNHIINSVSGSDTYCCPEIRKAHIQGYDGIKSDIFSLGVLLFVITVGKFPFNISGYSDKRYRLIMTKNFQQYWKGFEKDNLSEEFRDLMNHLICYDPCERFSIEEIMSHPWIKKYNYMEDMNDEEDKKNDSMDNDMIYELKERRNHMNTKRELY